MLTQIVRLTRASARHLATAQKHAGAAKRLRDGAARIEAGRTPTDVPDYMRAEAARLETLAARAMARHEAARAKLGA